MKQAHSIICLMLATVILLSSGQCRKDDISLALVNNSERSLYVFVNNLWPGVDPTYPDTTLRGEGLGSYPIIRPGRRQYFFNSGRSFVDGETFGVYGDTLSIVICDVDTLEKYPWAVIKEDYKILQRYDLSVHDLRELNNTLYYPPIGVMRHMKMYPPYGE